jgi:nucleoside-diphosphate-sugar epimerase
MWEAAPVSATRARTDLAFAPTVALEQGLAAQFDWMAQAGLFEGHD